MTTDDAHVIQTVVKAFRIVEALRTLERAGVTELATRLGYSKSSVYKHLDTLYRVGYVNKADSKYSLSLRFFDLGNEVRRRQTLFEIAKPYVDNLARTTGESVALAVPERDEVVNVYCAHGGGSKALEEGERRPMVESTAGKAILAFSSPLGTDTLCADISVEIDDELRTELGRVRDQRLAIDRSSTEQGVNAVAVPIRNADDRALGAICVCGSAASLSGKRLEEDIAGLLVSSSKGVEVELLKR
ncbi:IclR family transcriptional regulator [Halomarina pelagica]|uniref:IclR family transcriptional regulator n=1 Tax=Halomarina pelagica TaxID=2961599 RepID=UPI0020C371F1|nr:IclR family transcriptional regulator [Halomarina sp. BND7]